MDPEWLPNNTDRTFAVGLCHTNDQRASGARLQLALGDDSGRFTREEVDA